MYIVSFNIFMILQYKLVKDPSSSQRNVWMSVSEHFVYLVSDVAFWGTKLEHTELFSIHFERIDGSASRQIEVLFGTPFPVMP